MQKKAIITILLVTEASKIRNPRLAREIKESLQCSWLAEVNGVKIKPSVVKCGEIG